MSYKVAKTKEEGLAQLTQLVHAFSQGIKAFKASSYNETQLRSDFVDPLLMSFGWDVDNSGGKTQFLRDVIQEESITVEDETSKKNPDYTLRIQGNRKLFVEAKKPAVDISKSPKSAFQTRRYGWNAKLGISALTNFDKLILYDCRHKPDANDDEHVARVHVYDFSQYLSAFEEIYELVSFETASSGKLDDLFSVYGIIGQSFDDYFLEQIEHWRAILAQSAVKRNLHLKSEEINFLIQQLLNRIIFLRICEDRTIEKAETLKNIQDYNQLKALFQQSDRKYNSGLFDFIEDTLSLNIELDSEVLIEIFNELYYPLSPYDFAVVDPTILSQIYERFLGSHILLGEGRQLSIVSEPEVAASNGVVPTPKLVVEQIVKETLLPLIAGKTAFQIARLKIADICCGSGTFLISVYDFLLKAIIAKLQEEKITDTELIYEKFGHTLALTLKAKRTILEQNIFGVDVNPYAAEVTEFSLLLKLLEGENGASIGNFISQYPGKILPKLTNNIKCGNSLVDDKFFEFIPEAIDDNSLLYKVKPFNWLKEYPFLGKTKGFDAIVGNPPYVRIQNLVKYAPEEAKYYQSDASGYTVAKTDTIDKYYVFIERAISLLNPTGYLGYIVPHKFFIIKGGKALRKLINQTSSLSKIIHFGVTQVFPGRSTYTAILVLQKEKKEGFDFKRIQKVTPAVLTASEGYVQYDQEHFSDAPWIFLSKETQAVFNKIRPADTKPLKTIAEICVGLQTSSDKIYIFTPKEVTESTYVFYTKGIRWEIEKEVCLPCIYELSFELFDTIRPNKQMIFPYFIKDDKAEVILEDYFSEHYPLCWAYLIDHKVQLEKRSINGTKEPKFYQYGRSQSLTKFQDTSKLIWPVLSQKPAYIYDELNIQFTGGGNGPYYSLVNNSDYSILYFMGILSHPVFESMVKAGASEFRGAYYSHGKQFLENLPIKNIDKNNTWETGLYNVIIKSVKDLIETKGLLKEAYGTQKSVLDRKLALVNKGLVDAINELYGISQEEYDIVTLDPVVLNEITAEEE